MGVRDIKEKYHMYKANGIEALIPQKRNNRYSEAFKSQIIFEYFNQRLSSRQLAYKYNVRPSRTVRDWINKHIEGKENRSYSIKSEVPIMKSRKTTLEERIEIVKFVTDKDRSYREASAAFQVSYN
ncbi:transposase [Staphylococcus gallinarum]|nr:transposase [Staphylococcus gallinarum]